MYPLKFKPILKSTIWGGEKIIPFKHLDCQQAQVGESWEISDVPGDESVVADGADAGKNLTQMVSEYKGALVGESNYKRFNGKFPLLIKFIDAQQDLSIQVHPDDELAMKRHNSMGKTEMWYVIGNDGGKAHLRSGLSQQITPDQYAAMIATTQSVMPFQTMLYNRAMSSSCRQDVFTVSEQAVSSQKSSRLRTSRTVSMTSTVKTRTEIPASCILNCQKMQSIILYPKITVHITLLSRTNR